MLTSKLKCQMICSYIHISNSAEIYAFTSTINQGLEIHKHITLEKGMDVTIHSLYIPFTNLDHCNKITHNMSCSCANLIKECTTSNNGITTFNASNISTSVNKHKLDLAEIPMVTFNAIFMKRMQYLDNTCLTKLSMDIHLVLMFCNISLPFVSMISTNLANFECLLGRWLK